MTGHKRTLVEDLSHVGHVFRDAAIRVDIQVNTAPKRTKIIAGAASLGQVVLNTALTGDFGLAVLPGYRLPKILTASCHVAEDFGRAQGEKMWVARQKK
ncbi:MAG: hypothetical protein WAV41_05990 [Microgenomates group bacterium]